MLWIKRNLFLAVGGFIALLALLGGLYYLWSGIQLNNELGETVDRNQSTLEGLYNSPDPFPSRNNIELAKAETEKLRQAAAKSRKYFTPIPVEKMTGVPFRSFRDLTLDGLRKAATAADTKLPNPNYAFSFAAQSSQTQFSPGTFPLIPEQMAEVKAISEILFKASVKQISNIRRARISDEDTKTGGTDYLTLGIMTNSEAQVVTSPYEISFYSFSANLAQIMTAFGTAPFGAVVKAIQVEGEDASKLADAGAPSGQAVVASTPVRPGMAPPPARPGIPARLPAPGVGQSRPTAGASRRPLTILDEKAFKVTMLVYVVKPLK
jgi:hypothetical protein